jgi:hypothetical protein
MMLIVQPGLEDVKQVEVADHFTAFTQLNAAEVLGTARKLFDVGGQRVMPLALNHLVQSVTVSSYTFRTCGVSKLKTDRVPQSFAIVRAFPNLRDEGCTTTTRKSVGEVVESSLTSRVLQRRVRARGKQVVINAGPAVVRSEKMNEMIAPREELIDTGKGEKRGKCSPVRSFQLLQAFALIFG